MEPKKFWKLTFYEWSIWLLRIKLINNRRNFDHELMIRLSRRMMVVSARSMGAKNVKEEDFWRLKEDEEERPVVSKEENEEKVKRALELKINGRNSNK